MLCWALGGAAVAVAQSELSGGGSAAEVEVPERPRELNYTDAVILGVVEGITEYLPISSTGHLILANRLLGLDAPLPMTDAQGEPIWKAPPDLSADPPEPGRRYTLKDAADAYAIVIQAGAIAAVLLLYWGRVWGAARGSVFTIAGWVGVRVGDPEANQRGWHLGRNLIIAFLPAVILGLIFEDLIERHLFGPTPVVLALAVGAVLMLAVEHWRKRRLREHPDLADQEGPDLHELPPFGALLIGLLQCVAMWPGTSRSMMTIVGGYLAGLSPKRAAEFSFLLGLITLTAAAAYKLMKDGRNMLAVLDTGPVLVGCLVAFVSAALAVKWLVSYLSKHGLALFAWYRLALALCFFIFVLG